jgi:hypothetical protein
MSRASRERASVQLVMKMPGPTPGEERGWRSLRDCLKLAAVLRQAEAIYDDTEVLLAQLGSRDLFVELEGDSVARGETGLGCIRDALTKVRTGIDLPIPRGRFGDESVLCWAIHVLDGLPVKELGNRVGSPRRGFLAYQWTAPTKTVRERMWLAESFDASDVTRGAWPGITQLIVAVRSSVHAVLREQRGGVMPSELADGDDGEVASWYAGASNVAGTPLAVQEIRAGTRVHGHQTDLTLEDYSQHVHVDREGNVLVSFETVLRDTSTVTRSEFEFPIYSDVATSAPIADVSVGDYRRMALVADPWDEQRGEGFFRVPLVPPLQPHQTVALEASYPMLGAYRDSGEQFWEWYFGRPHYRYGLTITFDDAWQIRNVRGIAPDMTDELPQPIVEGNMVTWSLPVPRPGQRYRVEWTMTSAS